MADVALKKITGSGGTLAGCAIALEFKKFFMDEWTGVPVAEEVDAMRHFMNVVADTSRNLLKGHG